jgi:hypothetical protein
VSDDDSPAESEAEDSEIADTEPQDDMDEEIDEVEDCDESEAPIKKKHPIRNALLVLLSLAIIAAGILFYQFIYIHNSFSCQYLQYIL